MRLVFFALLLISISAIANLITQICYIFPNLTIPNSNTTILTSMKITIIHTNQLNKNHLKQLKNRIKLILKNLQVPTKTELCITFVDDSAMRKLNKNYRQINRTTDVLSFPQDVTNTAPDVNVPIARNNQTTNLILGDIVISIDSAKRHARVNQATLAKEIDKLIVHGILHLLGYDHKKKKDTILMRLKEKQLLSLIDSI